MIKGLTYGFHTGLHTGLQELPTKTLECPNLLSARSQVEVTSQLIQSELDKGFIEGQFTNFATYRVHPVGIAKGKYSKKKRLNVDLSAPILTL